MTRWISAVTKRFRMVLQKSGNENEEETRRGGGNSEMQRGGEGDRENFCL